MVNYLYFIGPFFLRQEDSNSRNLAVVLVSEDCGYSVDSVAGHISLERYSYQPFTPCRVPDLYDAPRNQEGLIPSILTYRNKW